MKREDFYANARHDLCGPIQGLTVLDVTTTWAGPMAGCVLADLGADVIKIEHPGGDVGRRLLPNFPDRDLGIPGETVNRNKRCVSLDLHADEGRKVFLQMAATADVVIENFKPGTMAGWQVGYPQVSAVKPDIVYVSISGFGQFGPLADRPGYDPIAQNFSGWTSLNGEPELGPTKAPTFLGDDLAGLHGAIGALAALRHRDATGEGQHVDVALVDSVIFQSNGNLSAGATGATLERWGNQFAMAAPINLYPTRDGLVFAGVLLDSHWQALCELIDRPDLQRLSLIERLERREDVNNALGQWCATRTRAEIDTEFAALGLPSAPVNSYADAANHAQIEARELLQTTKLSDGQEAPITGPAVKFSRTPTRVRHGAPTRGQDNTSILRKLGYSAEQIAELADHGVI